MPVQLENPTTENTTQAQEEEWLKTVQEEAEPFGVFRGMLYVMAFYACVSVVVLAIYFLVRHK